MSEQPDSPSDETLEYASWIEMERYRLAIELGLDPRVERIALHGPAYAWHSVDITAGKCPSSRAAAVLAAVGFVWEGSR